MRDRLAALLLPLGLLALGGVIVIGLLTAAPRSTDRASDLAERLRCPVCQGESVADSPSDTAIAIREQIDGMVAAGSSDQDVLDHYVARYGTWILLDPPMRGATLLVWLLPLVAAAAGVGIVISRRGGATPRPLDPDERALLERALAARDERPAVSP